MRHRFLAATSSGAMVLLVAASAAAETVDDPAEAGSRDAPAMEAGPAEAGPAAGSPQADRGPAEDVDVGDDRSKPAPNSIFVEGLGAGFVYSFNYERLVIDDLGVRAGFSYMSFGASATTSAGTTEASSTFMTFPITANYIGIRSGKHALELGGGATIAYWGGSASGPGVSASGSGAKVFGDALVGYRLHPAGGAGFQFRVGLAAILGTGVGFSDPDPSALGVLPWGYLSMGASF